MGTEQIRLISDDLGGVKLRFSGAKYFYGNSKVSKIIGVNKLTDRDNAKNKLKMKTQDYKKYLVRLTALCSGQVLGGVGTDQSQREKLFRINFYCHPDRADNAILELPGVNVDRGAGIGSLKINEVYRPRKVNYV